MTVLKMHSKASQNAEPARDSEAFLLQEVLLITLENSRSFGGMPEKRERGRDSFLLERLLKPLDCRPK